MNEYTLPDFDALLMNIAAADDIKSRRLNTLKQARQMIYDLHLAAIDAEIALIEQQPKQLRDELRDLVMLHIEETGDLTVHDLITPVRSKKLMYDDDEALAWCIDNGHDECIKTTLKKREFNKIADGFPGAERAPSLTVRIPDKLGHLLIEREHDEEQS